MEVGRHRVGGCYSREQCPAYLELLALYVDLPGDRVRSMVEEFFFRALRYD